MTTHEEITAQRVHLVGNLRTAATALLAHQSIAAGVVLDLDDGTCVAAGTKSAILHTLVVGAFAAQPVEAAGAVPKFTDAQREAVRDALSVTLGDAMDCTRVWSAWGVGTMSQDDFELLADNDERLEELVDEVERVLATHPAQPVEAAASPSELQQLKALALAATPGPWDWGGTECVSQEHALAICKENLDATAKPGTHFCEVFLADGRRTALVGNGPTGIENAAFIAAANPAVVLDLIARIESAAVSAATHPAEPVEAAGAVQAERNAALREVESVIEQVIEDLLSKKGQVSGAKFCLEAVRALAAHPAEPVGGELVASDEPLWIQLGQGKIEVGQGHHGPNGERLPAILFGLNGAGAVGIETEGDRVMNPGECIAAITFENPESLDVVAEKLAELRARIWPGTAPAGALVAMAEQVETDMADRLRRIVTNIGEGPIAVQSKLLFQAADECDRFYNGMMNWKANAQAKDRTIIELRESAPTESAAAPAELSVIREAVEAAFEERQGWRVKIAAAVRQLATMPIPTKGNDTDTGEQA